MTKKYSFEAETSKILELLTHSIYSNKEIFLRELISNSSDAIDKARITSLTDTTYLGDNTDFYIKIDINKEEKFISIEDNGTGMNENEVINNIGIIAKSGTKDFVEKLKESKTQNSLIGQFGVGFYSAFMVAKKVILETKSNDSEKSIIWESEGKGEYEINYGTKKPRGTLIKLFLNEDNLEFLENYKLRELIKKYSNYIEIPILMKEIETEEKKELKFEQINSLKAIWNKNKKDIKDEEYNEFYSSLSYDFNKPFSYIHLNTEGLVSYKSILYIPQTKNMFNNFDDPSKDYGPKLFVQNVMILEHAKDLLPVWLRFISGVVQTSDLPLNISREMLQSNQILDKIKKGLIKKIIDKLEFEMKNNKDYNIFLDNYSKFLKEGVYYDTENKEKIAGILKYKSLLKNDIISLDEYLDIIENNKNEAQDKKIYYITAKNINEALNNPYIENFKKNNIDVLILTDNIDEWFVQSLTEYKGYKLVSITSSEVNLNETGDNKEQKEKLEKTKKDFKDLLELIKNTIGTEKIEEVKISNRLVDSIGALTTKEGSITPQMEKIMKSMGQQIPSTKRILELNPDNKIVQNMLIEFKNDLKSEKLKDMILFTYEQAVLLEGGELDNMKDFIQRVQKYL